MKNNIITLLGFFLLANCTTIPKTDKEIETVEPSGIVTINTDPTIQAQHKAEWLALTKSIDRDNAYSGKADIWGGGALDLHLWFVDGDLWDYMDSWPTESYVLHTLVPNGFINGHTAVMLIPSSASYTLAGTLYIVKISNNTIYRTQDAWGFNHIDKWDGKQVDLANLVPIGTKK